MALLSGPHRIENAAAPEPPLTASPVRRANRRRLLVFVLVFVVAAAASLAYVLLRPPVYLASARLEITPGTFTPTGGDDVRTLEDSPNLPFFKQIQVLTSRPLLERSMRRLSNIGYDLSELGPDPLVGLQEVLVVEPVPDTHVVRLSATAGRPDLPTDLLDVLVAEYGAHLKDTHRGTSDEVLADLKHQANVLALAVTDKRAEVEAFGQHHNIVSLEREESEVLARLKGRVTALNDANKLRATLDADLKAVRAAVAEGKTVLRARDDPVLADMERRVSVGREQLRELRRRYTEAYLTLDPATKGLMAALAEMEEQLQTRRAAAAATALAEAEQLLTSASEAVRTLEQEIAQDRVAVRQFAANLEQYRTLTQALTRLEELHHDAAERAVRLETSERGRMPSVQVLEAAQLPQRAWRPQYERDAAIAVGGSFGLALLAMWFVELFNRAEPQPTLLVAQPVRPAAVVAGAERERSLPVQERPAVEPPTTARLAGPAELPREIAADDVASLLAAAPDDVRIAAMLLLAGVRPDEVVVVCGGDVDGAAGTLRIGGASPRTVSLPDPLVRLLAARAVAADTVVVADDHGASLTIGDLDTRLCCAALDAGLADAHAVTAAALWHSYVVFLLRQGVRFVDLVRVVGPLSQASLAAYGSLTPAGPRADLATIERVHPAVGSWAPASSGGPATVS